MAKRSFSSATSATAPTFTKEDEAREIAELTAEERDAICADLMGSNGIDNDVDDDVLQSMDERFIEEMDKLTCDEKRAYVQAKEISPLVVAAESDPARFLRAVDNYDPEAAAKLMALYWEKRVEIFGQDRAFLPMTLCGALRDDLDTAFAFQNRFRILPQDNHGRTVLCVDRTDASVDYSDRMPMIRVWWYVLHVALEQKSTQLKGLVIIWAYKRRQIKNFDRIRAKKMVNTLKEWLPVKVKSNHVLTTAILLNTLGPIIQVFFGPSLRRRFIFHDITKLKEVLESLKLYGIDKQNIPISIGGEYAGNDSWLEHRLYMEEQANEGISTGLF